MDTARAVRAGGDDVLLLYPAPPAFDGWGGGVWLAVESGRLATWRRSSGRPDPLGGIADRIRRRRSERRSRDTGVLVLLGYEFRAARQRAEGCDDGLPELIAWEVDAALRWTGTGVRGTGLSAARLATLAASVRTLAANRDDVAAEVCGAVRTSLPAAAYRRAVAAVLEHIGRGDIYQANLCQRFDARFRGDALTFFAGLAGGSEAPRCAYIELPGIRIASFSPETFLTVDGEVVETWPIKGTRRRHRDAAADRAAAGELLASEKDRAELLMIVDLERNDLGRVCRTGSVQVPVLVRLDSYATVHHLVACVRGLLRDPADVTSWIDAVFPGGSITGAPKRRAVEILAELEPVRRNFFTGSLLWFADDGSVESSILIRTAVFERDRVYLGAGGGVVADSDPAAEWRESNDKVRAIAGGLGFEPEAAC